MTEICKIIHGMDKVDKRLLTPGTAIRIDNEAIDNFQQMSSPLYNSYDDC